MKILHNLCDRALQRPRIYEEHVSVRSNIFTV